MQTIERKRYLSGDQVTFICELVALEAHFGILKYVIDREWHVKDLILRPGTVTYGFYWLDRPYNLYWWINPEGRSVGYYFNLADEVRLSAQEFVWRDLIVDVLIIPDPEGGLDQTTVHVIDEEEVPDSLDEELRATIEKGKRKLLRAYPRIIREAQRKLGSYVPLG